MWQFYRVILKHCTRSWTGQCCCTRFSCQHGNSFQGSSTLGWLFWGGAGECWWSELVDIFTVLQIVEGFYCVVMWRFNFTMAFVYFIMRHLLLLYCFSLFCIISKMTSHLFENCLNMSRSIFFPTHAPFIMLLFCCNDLSLTLKYCCQIDFSSVQVLLKYVFVYIFSFPYIKLNSNV